jgi:uncharacterized protein (DUF488 family)
MQIWTIGHSTRTIEEFLAALRANSIQTLVDVRRFPASRRNPQLERSALEKSLRDGGIKYVWMGELLGGRRSTTKASQNIALRSKAFRGYADYMLTQEFRRGADELRVLAADHLVAIMCAELLWWNCHRSMISDFLVGVFGDQVTHIRDASHSDRHSLKDAATVHDQVLIYERNATKELF